MRADFVDRVKQKVWEGYDIMVGIDRDIASWLYDAACILDIARYDERICAILDDYYDNPQKLPWNKGL
jgi:hypothetical protein